MRQVRGHWRSDPDGGKPRWIEDYEVVDHSEVNIIEHVELCPTCGQPDNCGDCNHTPITNEALAEMEEDYRLHDEGIEYSRDEDE